MLTRALVQYTRVGPDGNSQALYEVAMLEFGLRHWSPSAAYFEKLLARSTTFGATEMHSAALCAIALYTMGKKDRCAVILDKYSRHSSGQGIAGKVLRYFAGQIQEAELDAAAKNTQDRTLTNFYIAAKLARFDKLAEARERLIWVRDKGDQRMDQYLLAIMELADVEERLAAKANAKAKAKKGK